MIDWTTLIQYILIGDCLVGLGFLLWVMVISTLKFMKGKQ